MRLNHILSGPADAPVAAFSNSLGTTLAMWDAVVPHLSNRYRILRYDTRGHGGSETRDAPAEIDDLATDLLALLDDLGIARIHGIGLSLGGMTMQALASSAPDRVASLTLMATAAFMPSEATWNERAATVRQGGTQAIVEATLGRWFTPGFAERRPDVVDPIRTAFTACDRRRLRGLLRRDRSDGPSPASCRDHRPDAGHRRPRGPGDAPGDGGGDLPRHPAGRIGRAPPGRPSARGGTPGRRGRLPRAVSGAPSIGDVERRSPARRDAAPAARSVIGRSCNG